MRARHAPCQWPLRSVGAILRPDWTSLPINGVDAYFDCILKRSDQPNADLQILSLCGLGAVLAALCLECVSRTSNQQSASNSATKIARGVSPYACPSDRRDRSAGCCGNTRDI